MEKYSISLSSLSTSLGSPVGAGALSYLIILFLIRYSWLKYKNRSSTHLPGIPGSLPILGNLLQLKGGKPFQILTGWAEIYGPLYSIQLGSSHVVVVSSAELAKEVMVTRYDAITHRDMTYGLRIISHNGRLVSMTNNHAFYEITRRHLLANVLGCKAMKRSQDLRDALADSLTDRLHAHLKSNPAEPINFRRAFDSELLGFSLKQAVGCDVQSLYVEELRRTMSRDEIHRALVLDPMKGITMVSAKDIFSYLKWIPVKCTVEKEVTAIDFRRMAVMKALIQESKRLCNAGQEMDCFYDTLKSQPEIAKLTDQEIALLVWEPINGCMDPISITVEWALFELAKDTKRQDLLHREIKTVCGSEKISESHLSRLPYLRAVINETLRAHPPAPAPPFRFVNKDIQVGGHHVRAGSKILINIYGCNKNKKCWKDAHEWIPERFACHQGSDQQHLFKTMSFGYGKRACTGAAMSMLLCCLTVARVVQKFEFKLSEMDKGEADTVGVTSHKLDPLHVLLKPRS